MVARDLSITRNVIFGATERAKIALSFIMRTQWREGEGMASPHLLNRESLVDRVRALSHRSTTPPLLLLDPEHEYLVPGWLRACRGDSNFVFSYPCVPLFLL